MIREPWSTVIHVAISVATLIIVGLVTKSFWVGLAVAVGVGMLIGVIGLLVIAIVGARRKN